MVLVARQPVQTRLQASAGRSAGLVPTPFLKWAGGKGQLLDQLTRHFPSEFGTYFEPFVGGGAVFFHLRPQHAVLSDSNPDLIQAYEAVRDDPEGLMSALDTFRGRIITEELYYSVRRQNPRNLSALARAARTIFLNKTCFNGLYRVNSNGEFNVPFGSYKSPTLYVRENILAASLVLKNAELQVEDFRESCKAPRKGDFVYLDPPYDPLSKTSSFTDYTRGGFKEQDQRDLSEMFRELDRKGCRVMLSNSPTPMLRELYRDFKCMTLKARRAINCKGIGRGAVDELLVVNY